MQLYLASTLVLLVLLALAQNARADSLTLLKPNATDKPHVGVVFIQGTQIVSKAYIPLMEKLQATAAPYFSVFASVPAFVLSIPEPAQIGSCVSSAKKAMYAAGLDKDAPIVVMGHSLGGIMGQDYVFGHKDEIDALILMGAGLARKYRNGTASYTYPVPTLTLDGTLDGLYRVTRQAESYYHQILHAKDQQNAVEMFPVVVYEGVTHMQFASGTPPFAVKNADLKPEVSYDDAHAAMASSMTMFLVGRMGGAASSSIKSQMWVSLVDGGGGGGG